ncbi:BMP family lipoprotein (plasmid) [Coraliomargarita sp. W4R53]
MSHSLRARGIVGGAFAVAAALTLTACGGQAAVTAPTADADAPSVALLFGTLGDFALMDSAYSGFEEAQQTESFQALEFSSPNTDDYQDRLDLALDQSADLAIGIGFQWTGPMSETAHPDTAFVNVDVDRGTVIDDVTTISFAANQSSYLAGVAAALTSESGHIGFVGGVDMPLIEDFYVGYEAGAQSVDDDIVIDSTYLAPLGDFTGFSDPTKGKEAAATMYAGGADVIYTAAGGSGQGIYEQAAAASTQDVQLWAIGVDGDVYLSVADEIKPHILTSAVKHTGVAVSDSITAFIDGSLAPGEQLYDLSNDGVGLATSGGFLDAIQTEIDAATVLIINGDVVVPSVI